MSGVFLPTATVTLTLMAMLVAALVGVTPAEGKRHPATASAHLEELLPLLPRYEVVRSVGASRGSEEEVRESRARAAPEALEAAHPEEEELHPSVLRYEFEALGLPFRLRLEKNHGLFHPQYRETRFGEGGRVVSRRHRHEVANCHYIGRVESDTASERVWAALSTCNGLRGVIHAHNGTFMVEPLLDQAHVDEAADAAGRHPRGHGLVHELRGHVVYSLADLPDHHVHPFVCGHDQTPDERHEARRKMAAAAGMPEPSAARGGPRPARNAEPDHHHHHHHHHDGGGGAHLHGGREHATVSSARARQPSTLASQLSTGTAYPEILVANDYYRFLVKGVGTEAHTGELFNQVIAMYTAGAVLDESGTSVRVVLRGQITWTTEAETMPGIVVSGDAGMGFNVDFYLQDWADLRRTPANVDNIDHDNGALLSGNNFEQNIVGYAYTFGMCRADQTASINQVNHYTADSFDAATIAHEIGHNMGMCHDPPAPRSGDCDLLTSVPNTAVCSGFIMSASSSTNDPNVQFSRCSAADWRHFVQEDAPSFSFVEACMDFKASFETWYNTSECGNGFRELDETCDCNGAADCAVAPAPYTDECCDGATCQLLPGSVCSNSDPCCEDCRLVAAGTVCRPVDTDKDPCDVAERCDGLTSACPADLADCDATGSGFLQQYTTEIIVASVAIVMLFFFYKCVCSTWKCCCGEGPPQKDKKKRGGGKRQNSGKRRGDQSARSVATPRSMRHSHRAAAPEPTPAAAAAAGPPGNRAPSLPPGWQVRYRANGQPVYINAVTGEIYDFSSGN